MDLDGTHQQTLVTTSPYFYALTLYDPPAPVPEPCTLIIWSLLGGLGAAIGLRRRKRAG
jgi:hypothetical protein